VGAGQGSPQLGQPHWVLHTRRLSPGPWLPGAGMVVHPCQLPWPPGSWFQGHQKFCSVPSLSALCLKGPHKSPPQPRPGLSRCLSQRSQLLSFQRMDGWLRTPGWAGLAPRSFCSLRDPLGPEIWCVQELCRGSETVTLLAKASILQG
jgi:hypothetical protein